MQRVVLIVMNIATVVQDMINVTNAYLDLLGMQLH